MITYVFWGLISLGMFFAVLRVILGPGLGNRVAALDSANIIATALLLMVARASGNGLFLDIALVYALLAFMETVVIARFIEKGGSV